ncbi:MAG: YabP/YqfC family sporulation protein [Eubacteriales bacterium]|nr:YabP/YqfC family sporulation protein [Eubacteriales bacterium]MDD3882540.1 YabP/YqfC family sporulation protein [Eubacteriales bacterium]MDD4512840.1 YabP/YqfC family sporulation protein [Eubacteriales bacterium]
MRFLSGVKRDAAEILGGQPRVTLSGREEVLIEGHRGITFFSRERIVLRTKRGELAVSGFELAIKDYATEDALICGRVLSVGYSAEERSDG